MKKIYLDLESRSRVDLWKTGVAVYAAHPSTEVLCLAYAIDDGPVKIIRYADLFTYPLGDPFEELRALATDKDVLFYAHSAIFEQFLWKFKLSDRFNIPIIPIKRWRCTAAKALAVGLPKSLADVGAALGTAHKKDLKGKAIMLKMCKPKVDGTFIEDPDLFAELEAYCAQDVEGFHWDWGCWMRNLEDVRVGNTVIYCPLYSSGTFRPPLFPFQRHSRSLVINPSHSNCLVVPFLAFPRDLVNKDIYNSGGAVVHSHLGPSNC